MGEGRGGANLGRVLGRGLRDSCVVGAPKDTQWGPREPEGRPETQTSFLLDRCSHSCPCGPCGPVLSEALKKEVAGQCGGSSSPGRHHLGPPPGRRPRGARSQGGGFPCRTPPSGTDPLLRKCRRAPTPPRPGTRRAETRGQPHCPRVGLFGLSVGSYFFSHLHQLRRNKHICMSPLRVFTQQKMASPSPHCKNANETNKHKESSVAYDPQRRPRSQ